MKLFTKAFGIFGVAILMLACNQPAQNQSMQSKEAPMPLKPSKFQKEINGKQTNLYILKNDNGMKVAITNYGGRVVSIMAPDKNGDYGDVALGYDSIDGYLNNNNNYFGALIGRFGNRIANGKFSLDGKQYTLPKNDGPNTLHGGTTGFDSKVWDAKQLDDQNLRLTYVSDDMEMGFPGRMVVEVLYTLTPDNGLRMNYHAITNKKTVINLTNHTYFNLEGAGSGDVYDQEMMINADNFTPIDSTLIPTGEIAPVEGTPLDFTEPTPIGKRVDNDYQQLTFAGGYDHNFVLNKEEPGTLTLAASVFSPNSGRNLKVYTTEPGVQFYSGNFLDGSNVGKGGKKYTHRSAFTLEAQHYPDSPNEPDFPSTVLNPGEIYNQITIYQFGTGK